MYEINSENLKWAFKKLKRYIYYYNSSNYLKKRIIDFQNKFNHNTFEKMAENLVNLSKVDKGMLSDSGITFLAYPKKDSTNFNYDKQKIEINELNLFIDMPIMYYLVDILFCLEIYNRFDFHHNNCSFGNKFDNKFQHIDPLKNNLLFGSHTTNYNKWKNSIYKTLSENTTHNNLLIKLDFKHCFYNVSINIIDFLSKYFNAEELEKPIVKIMINIYRLYTKTIILNNMSDGNSFETNYVNLPIGLLSSYPILNILLTDLDKKITSNIKCIGYSRYVDDMLIVVKYDEQKLKFKDKKEIISNIFPDVFVIENDKLFTVNEVLFCKKLEVNNKKIDCVPYRKGTNFNAFKKKINSLLKPSLDFDDEIDDDESSTEIDFSLGLEYLKSRTNKYLSSFRNDEIEEGVVFFEELKFDDLINLYPYWKDILNFIKINNKEAEALNNYKNKILDSINNIEITNSSAIKSERLEYVCEVMKKTLKNELTISEYYVEKNINNEHFIFRLNYEQIINYISLCVEQKLDTYSWLIYPTEVLFEEISFYLSVHHQEWIDTIYDKCHDIFKRINGYEKYRDTDLIVENNDNIITIYTSDSKLERKHRYLPTYKEDELIEEKIKVAVANMAMDPSEIEMTEIETKFPKSYKFNEIIKMIKSAKKKDAEIIVFPEFCIPYTYAFEMIRLCNKNRISLICGLTHYYINDKVAVNVTLIYDNQLKLSLGKIKNYLAPEEKIILAKRNKYFEESLKNYYFILDNGNYQYSTMTCYEATNISDRAKLADQIEVLYMPVFNRDTKYFSNIIESFARDASCYIAQSNTNFYGDSRITGPYNEIYMDVVKLKGGTNNYYVLADISLHELSVKHTNDEHFIEDINLLREGKMTFEKFKEKEKENKNYPNKDKRIKSLVAGNHKKRKDNCIR